jgi:hypothetical protein
MLLLAIATVIAGVFFGAALYVNLVEHPARVSCGPATAVEEFRPSYRRGAIMQGGLSAVGCALLLSSAADRSASQTLELFARWNRRHWIRTVLGGLAFLLLISRSLWR